MCRQEAPLTIPSFSSLLNIRQSVLFIWSIWFVWFFARTKLTR
jgi:hypothetical protein